MEFIVALSGGGTGGHFYPMLAFARFLRSKGFKRLLFFGDKKGIEGRNRKLLEGIFSEYRLFELPKFKGGKLRSLPMRAFKTLKVSREITKTLKGKPFVSLTFGGYTSAPLGFSTFLLKKPLFIHEQNAVPGMGNRILSKFAKKIFITFPNSGKFFPSEKVVLTGIPLREEVKRFKKLRREEVLRELGWEERFTLTVLGGSLGAKSLNSLAVELSKNLPSEFRLVCITGREKYKEVKTAIEGIKPKCEVRILPYTENIGAILRISDFAISRAGASTSAELSYFGIPTLFVPYPYAAYDHQYYNALYYAKGGGAYLFREEDLNVGKVFEIVIEHYRDEKLKREKARLMEKSFIPNAEERMLKEMKDFIF